MKNPEPKPESKAVGLCLRELRNRRRLGLQQVALEAGVPIGVYKTIERGLTVPSDDETKKLAQYFGVDPTELLSAQTRFSEKATPGEKPSPMAPDGLQVFEPIVAPARGKLRVVDLFCGCGGLSYGLEWEGSFATVLGIDILHDRIETFRRNHPAATAISGGVGDAIDAGHLDLEGGIDVLVGGPPCQGFSSIRPFRGLSAPDPRNSLVHTFVDVVEDKRPRWVVLENVVGLLNHGGGELLTSIATRLRLAGYVVNWKVLNASAYGIPQNRERLFVIAHEKGLQFDWPEPSRQATGKSMARAKARGLDALPLFAPSLRRPVTVDEALSDLPCLSPGEESLFYALPPQNEYQRLMRSPESSRVSFHRGIKHSKRMLEIIKHAGSSIRSLPPGLVTSGFSSCYSRLDADSPSTTITVNFIHPSSNRCIHPTQDRALTIREGARLQGFPDKFEFAGTISQVAKQIGNAVPPLLALELAKAIARAEGRDVFAGEQSELSAAR